MNNIAINEIGDPVALANCPFRMYRPASEDHQQRNFKEIICEAGGGFVLGTTETAAAQKLCRSCDIPTSLNLKYACLYVVPFRVFQDNHVQSYYGCRWYFRLNPQKVPKSIDWCMGCRDWFPRPQKFLVPGQIRISRKFRHIFLNPSESREFSSVAEAEDKRNWVERLRDLF